MLGRSRLALFTLWFGALAVACSATDSGSTAPRDQKRGGGGNAGGGNGLPGDDFEDEFDDGDNVDENSACAAVKRTGELVPLDMFVMLDRSGSMDEGGRWLSVTNAIKSFVDSNDSRGMGIGLGLYPVGRNPSTPPPPAACTSSADCAPHYGDCLPLLGCEAAPPLVTSSCLSADYAKPKVPMQLLPMAAGTIKQALDSASPGGDITPTFPALDGAHIYAAQWAKQNPGHVTVVVLATDGEPNNCGSISTNTTTNIAKRAEQAYKNNPSIRTFVIGVGDKVGDLNAIAASGGTGQAVYLSDANAYQGLLDALNEIRGSVACEYQIPLPEEGKEPDYDRLNVNITAEGKTETIGRVAAPSECHPDKGGWYYDNPNKPSKIMLCAATCQMVKSGSQMEPVQVDVLLGCKTKIW